MPESMNTTTQQTIFAVEALLSIPFLVIGLSHLCQPRMWHSVFVNLAAKGHAGVVERTFLFELWPALVIVVFHQDWSWPGLLVTVYGHALVVKVVVGLVLPDLGLKSLSMSDRGHGAIIPTGIALCLLGLMCCARVLGFFN